MPEKRPPPFFLADAPGLDFLNTVAAPEGVPVDWIANGADLLAWLGAAGLVPAPVIASMRSDAEAGRLDTVAAEARVLREWFRRFVEKHRGKPLKRTALRELEPLNRILARDEEYVQLAAREPGATTMLQLELRMARRWRSPDMLLLPVARALAAVISEDDFTHVKVCEGTGCTLCFVDRTRGRARRWCSMAICGNRAKQAAHRARTRS